MSMTITPEQERALKKIARAGGYESPEQALTEAIELLGETNGNGSAESDRKMSHVQWKKLLEEHIASVPHTTATFVDDSRESIYEGRGE